MRVSGANLDDRALDIIAVEHLSARRLLQAALQPILGISRPIHGIHTLHAAHLTVHTSTRNHRHHPRRLPGRRRRATCRHPQEFDDVGDDTDA